MAGSDSPMDASRVDIGAPSSYPPLFTEKEGTTRLSFSFPLSVKDPFFSYARETLRHCQVFTAVIEKGKRKKVKGKRRNTMNNDRKIFVEQLKKRLLVYCKNVVAFVDSIPWSDFSGKIIAKQLLRSATSIAANYFEAQAAPTRKDFSNFLSISLKSANETIFWFDLLLECKKGNSTTIIALRVETVELANYFGSSVKKLRR